MQQPTKEQILYGQLAIAASILEYIGDNLEDTIFEGKRLEEITATLVEGTDVLQKLMQKSFKESQGVQSVCY